MVDTDDRYTGIRQEVPMRQRVWLVVLVLVVVGGATVAQEEGATRGAGGGGGPLPSLVFLRLDALDAAVSGAGFPALPELIVAMGGVCYG
jgi:hypothetical protein